MNQVVVKICIIYPEISGLYFLVLHRSMQAQYFPGMGDLPGGKVHSGENLIDAIKREVNEETGLTLQQQIDELFVHQFSFVDQIVQEHVFVTTVSTQAVCINMQEHDSFSWVRVETLAETNMHPELKKILLAHIDKLQRYMKKNSEDVRIKEAQTIAYYDTHAQQWIERHGPDAKGSFWEPELLRFQEIVPSGSILEIGVGGAGEAALFIRNGYVYTGIDAAQGLIDAACRRFPGVRFLQQKVEALDLPPHSFDGFWCSAVLLHISPEKIDSALQNIKTAMKPGAHGFMSLAQGHGEYYDEKTGRYFYLYEPEEFERILKRNGFSIEHQAIRTQDTPRAWLRSWMTFFVRVDSQ